MRRTIDVTPMPLVLGPPLPLRLASRPLAACCPTT